MPRYAKKRRSYKSRPKRGRASTYKKRRYTTKRTARIRSRLGVPRTLQIESKRKRNIVRKFVVNQTYSLRPGAADQAQSTTCYQVIKANSPLKINAKYSDGFDPTTIFNSINPTMKSAAAIWVAQDQTVTTGYGPNGAYNSGTQDVPGIRDDLARRYQHFTVLGAKVTVTLTPTKANTILPTGIFTQNKEPVCDAPVQMFMFKTGTIDPINIYDDASKIAQVPFVVRKNFCPGSDTTQSVSMSMTYSAKRYEGVRGSVMGHDHLRGKMPLWDDENKDYLNPGQDPNEKSFFVWGICDARGAGREKLQKGNEETYGSILPEFLVQQKIEYVVALTEPSKISISDDANEAAQGMMVVKG